jgi:hypothetical protein
MLPGLRVTDRNQHNRVALRDIIVSHTQPRLLRRLDSKHQFPPEKPRTLKIKISVVIRLRNVLELFKKRHGALPKDHQPLWPLARSLEQRYLQLEKLSKAQARSKEGQLLLKSMLDTLSAIHASHMAGLKQVLDLIPSNELWDPKAKPNFLRKFEKLCHYTSAAITFSPLRLDSRSFVQYVSDTSHFNRPTFWASSTGQWIQWL